MNQSDSLSPFQPPKRDGSALAVPVNVQGDLIDLNTPKEDQKFVQTDVCRPKVFSSNPKAEGATAANLGGGESEARKVSNSVSADSMSTSNSLHVSHTESGYLTDSVTSSSSRDRNPSIGSEADKTPCHETHQTSSSETTPCTDALMSFAGGGEQSKTLQSSGFHKLQNGAANGGLGIGISNEEALARLDLNCDMKNTDIGNIFATNTVRQRPESLILSKSVQKSDSSLRRSDSDSFKYSTAAKAYTANVESMKDYRKRSKSYGVPIPRLKEGVNIMEEGLSKSLPHGQIMKSDAGLIEFIADDLEEKIRRSSPASKTGNSIIFKG